MAGMYHILHVKYVVIELSNHNAKKTIHDERERTILHSLKLPKQGNLVLLYEVVVVSAICPRPRDGQVVPREPLAFVALKVHTSVAELDVVAVTVAVAVAISVDNSEDCGCEQARACAAGQLVLLKLILSDVGLISVGTSDCEDSASQRLLQKGVLRPRKNKPIDHLVSMMNLFLLLLLLLLIATLVHLRLGTCRSKRINMTALHESFFRVLA